MEYAYVGSYTTPKRGGLGHGGISVFSRAQEREPWQERQVYEMMNPSYLAFGREKQNLYAVRADGCVITAFSIDPAAGTLTYLNEKHIGFDNGVFVTVDAASRHLFAASPGGIVSIALTADGALDELCDITIPSGELGPLRPAQRRACSHQICFDRDGTYLIEPNKGLDQLNTYRVEEESGRIFPVCSAKMPQGCCPRHVAFHPTAPMAYLLTEWIGRIVACTYEDGRFTPRQILSTTPETAVPLKNLGAEIAVHPSGKFLYSSNRGHNSIAAFHILPDGLLRPIAWYGEGVAKPRFFTLSQDGRFLYCANEESHSVTLFSIHPQDGTLSFEDTVMHASAPACIQFRTTT